MLPEILGYTRAGRPVYPIAGGDGDGGAGDGGAGSQGDPGQQGAPASGDPDEALLKDPRGALELIRNLRAYERGDKVPAKLQKQLDDLTGKVSGFESAKLSDQEKATKRVSELEGQVSTLTTKLQEQAVKTSVYDAAREAGARYPADVWRLIELAEVEYDATSGEPTNIAKLVEKVRKDRPDYFKPGGGNGSGDGGARKSAASGDWLRDLIGSKG